MFMLFGASVCWPRGINPNIIWGFPISIGRSVVSAFYCVGALELPFLFISLPVACSFIKPRTRPSK